MPERVKVMEPYVVLKPDIEVVPIVLSVPHCGTDFPPDLRDDFVHEFIEKPDDTDWFVHKLYDFAPSMGITVIHAKFSRWVIDLNRDPEGKPLYSDGRLITGVCPTTTFTGEPLYRDRRTGVGANEMNRRRELYFDPYHERLQLELTSLRQKFESVLLWDCHSIRQIVPSIQKDRFPDLILGDADGSSASKDLIDRAVTLLGNSRYSFAHNHPFKGGYITRQFGRPDEHIHALQLEMTKVNYMDDTEMLYDERRAGTMSVLLKKCLHELAYILIR